MEEKELHRLQASEIADTLYDLEMRLHGVNDALRYGAVDEAHDGLYANSCEGLALTLENVILRMSKTRERFWDYVEKEHDVARSD